MVGRTALTRRRPTKTSDGAGGFTEALGAALTFYGIVEHHADRVELLCEIHDDVDVPDLVNVPGFSGQPEAQYRVSAARRLHGSRWKRLTLIRVERPIEP